MTGIHSESNLAVLNFLANEFTWGGVCGGGGGCDCCHSSLQRRKLQGFKAVGFLSCSTDGPQ